MWEFTLGKLDIAASVMTMSRLREAPRVGHLRQVQRIFGYLANFLHGAIMYKTYERVYAGSREELPHNLPKPLGRQVTSTHYVDANLHYDLVTRKAVTAVLHMLNATPVHWYCKRQLTVETASFSSEFVSARTAVDQIIDLQITLMYLGIPITPKSYMFGDNKAVVTNATIPISTLSPRDPTLLPIIEFEKPWQQDISSSIGRMGNPILQTSLANIWDLLVSGLFYNIFFSGGEIHLNLPPNQRGVTEFQPKRALSNSNPNG